MGVEGRHNAAGHGDTRPSNSANRLSVRGGYGTDVYATGDSAELELYDSPRTSPWSDNWGHLFSYSVQCRTIQ